MLNWTFVVNNNGDNSQTNCCSQQQVINMSANPKSNSPSTPTNGNNNKSAHANNPKSSLFVAEDNGCHFINYSFVSTVGNYQSTNGNNTKKTKMTKQKDIRFFNYDSNEAQKRNQKKGKENLSACFSPPKGISKPGKTIKKNICSNSVNQQFCNLNSNEQFLMFSSNQLLETKSNIFVPTTTYNQTITPTIVNSPKPRRTSISIHELLN
ncbi:hypothetical protein ABK040_015944 [Willaertia magna]